MNLYEVLGVATDASQAAIKAAFRKLAQKNHPDKESGDKETMQAIQQAYDVLSDPERRAQYDETGELPGTAPTLRDKAIAVLAQHMEMLFDHVVQTKKDVDWYDPIDAVREQMHLKKKQVQEVQTRITKLIGQRKKALKRLMFKVEGSDTMRMILEGQIQALVSTMEQNETQVQLIHGVLDLLAEYEYRADTPPAPVQQIITLGDMFDMFPTTRRGL